ncbi:acyl-[acyl-carrier-protein] thioesterase [Paenibacillus sp. sgz5001063]|uniref:acyl-[acyl-carrier-protein] thioesterase n=1 Tax=Paenibacillus sp. sgz5001063 TaxID=3242474 RepID=UPI0036D3C42B
MDKSTTSLWTEQFAVQANDTDYRSQAKLSFLLEILQRTADAAVNALGFSLTHMQDAGMGWMLITLDLEIRRMPRINDQLTVRTWSKGTKGALWQRDYRVYDQDHIEVAVARSIWALVDIEKRRILRPTAISVPVIHYDGDSVGSMPEKVTISETLSLHEAYAYKVRFSGLDSNLHLNNARYGEICSDALSIAEWGSRELKRFRVTYVQEARLGDELQVQRSVVTDDGIYIQGIAGDKVFFTACLGF